MPVLLRVPWGGGKRPMDPSKLSPVLAENPWKMIAQASEEGIASQIWSVGDGIDIVLSGDYSGSVTMQIAGFDHDSLAEGGKAGITFISKQVLGGAMLHTSSSPTDGWKGCRIRGQEMAAIKDSLPDDVKSVLKTALKTSSSHYAAYTTEDDVFIPSLAEISSEDSGGFGNLCDNVKSDGTMYDIFDLLDDVRKKSIISGGTAEWWTRSIGRQSPGTSTYTDAGYVLADGRIYRDNPSSKKCVCFGFCV